MAACFVRHAARRVAVLLTTLVAIAGTSVSASADSVPRENRADTLQVLADLTLIDGSCRNVVVNFGVAFRFAERQGMPASAMLPGGIQRRAFERVLQDRRASFGHDELCGEIANNYVEALPGSVTDLYTRADRP